MSEPVVFISHFRVKEGMLDGFKKLLRDVTRQMQEEKPRTLAYLFYLSEDATELSIVHVFGDAISMDAHSDGAQERSKAAYEFIEPQGWEIYGSPSSGALQMLQNAAASAGVALDVQPTFTDGFLRGAAVSEGRHSSAHPPVDGIWAVRGRVRALFEGDQRGAGAKVIRTRPRTFAKERNRLTAWLHS